MQRTALRRVAVTALALAALGGGALATAGSASALQRDGYMEAEEFGLYYSPDRGGAVFDLRNSDEDFTNDRFLGTGAGAGQSVDNNTASYWNNDTYRWLVYTGTYRQGIVGSLPPGYIGNATVNFRNQISSAYFEYPA
ncbi:MULTISPECIES: peptidase inhibitor family I36 protein [unclassified Streptomyces]|uniref:peptidase inhibitor family I36 protein n=1 Tax=unclassified Streptomyces TaxID=2593676 RepID=UPI00166033CE|nr:MULTISPECIES: peptidase inhibitor family I36 protein [unclassified Streptomyces]MBD0707174.1 hypothetical protein [Streptomyces sp. CBMA291]MBD0713662.1 hypothetical protein [Streptomyces sp. CBMA370]